VIPPKKPITSDRTLALAVAFSLLLHALLLNSWATKKTAETPPLDADIPLEVTADLALAPVMDACPPDPVSYTHLRAHET